MKKSIYKVAVLGAVIVGVMAPSEHAFNGTPPPPPLSIIQVPDYLFGSATYATPIKFRIDNCDTATISSIVATLYYDRGTNSKTLDISSRFVAEDGPAQNNGSTRTYTCYVPASFYSNVLITGAGGGQQYKDSQARFSLQVTFIPTTGGVVGSPTTLTSSASSGTIPEGFIDRRIDCVELPYDSNAKVHTISLGSGSQAAAMAKNGVTQFDEFQRGAAPFPEQPIAPPPGGFHIQGSDDAVATCNVTGSTLQARTRLYDDTDYNAGTLTGFGAHARAYGLQRGAYFYVSYGGKTVTPLGSEAVMDLSKVSGSFDMNLFTAQYRLSLVHVQSGGLNLGGITAGAFGIGWALAPAGGWSAAFGVASSIFSMIASVDFDGDQSPAYVDCADGYASYIESHITKNTPATPPGSGTSHNAFPPPVGAGSVAADLKAFGKACHVGDQWTYAVNLQSTVTAVSRAPVGLHLGPFSVDCVSDVQYIVSSVSDLDDMVVTTQ